MGVDVFRRLVTSPILEGNLALQISSPWTSGTGTPGLESLPTTSSGSLSGEKERVRVHSPGLLHPYLPDSRILESALLVLGEASWTVLAAS